MVEVEGQTQASSNGVIGNFSVPAEHTSFAASPTQPQPNDTADIFSSCPQCGGSRINRNGFRTLKNKEQTQVFVCKDCGYRFSQNYKKCTGQHNYANYALIEEAKKLEPVTETKTVTSDEKDVKGKILQHHVQMKLDGYKDSTIRLSKSALNTLTNRGADLTNPQTVKKVISEQSWSGNRKRNVINAYTKFLDFTGLTWQPPNYEITRKIPFIPTEQEIDDLIAASPNPLGSLPTTAQRNSHEKRRSNRNTLERRRLRAQNHNVQLPRKRQQPQNIQRPKRKTPKHAQQPTKRKPNAIWNSNGMCAQKPTLPNQKTISLQTWKPTSKRNPLSHPKTLESNNAIPLQTRHTDSCRVPRTQRPRKHTPVHFT